MEEKRADLESEKQRKLLQRLVEELSQLDMNFYYQPTIEIAFALKDYIKRDAKLTLQEKDLLEPLKTSDIQILLSLR
ncbi:MAG: hypothetical protein AAGB16_00320 [Pseudomonadota bacterium]